jgi:hypothetical protein
MQRLIQLLFPAALFLVGCTHTIEIVNDQFPMQWRRDSRLYHVVDKSLALATIHISPGISLKSGCENHWRRIEIVEDPGVSYLTNAGGIVVLGGIAASQASDRDAPIFGMMMAALAVYPIHAWLFNNASLTYTPVDVTIECGKVADS